MSTQEEKSWTNYWKLDESTVWANYVYVDKQEEYLADSMFKQEGIEVHFKNELIREEVPYCIIFCEVKISDEEKFCNLMQKLGDNMLLSGHDDYPDVCREVAETVADAKQ